MYFKTQMKTNEPEKIRLYSTTLAYLLVRENNNVLEILRLFEKPVLKLHQFSSDKETEELLQTYRTIEQAKGSTMAYYGIYCGAVGAIKLDAWHLVMAMTEKPTGRIGEHSIYKVSLKFFPFENVAKTVNEYLDSLQLVFSQEDFFCSVSYNLSLTVQQNNDPAWKDKTRTYFVWNRFLLNPFFESNPSIDTLNEFCVELFFGFIDYRKLFLNGKEVFVTLLARRSNRFAGVRFRRRGINEKGFVGNEVETELVVSVDRLIGSFVVHRGSIPVFWGQPAYRTAYPKIELVEPKVSSAKESAPLLHFARLERDYGSAIFVLSLLRTKTLDSSENIIDQAYKILLQKLTTKRPHLKVVRKEIDFLWTEKNGANVRSAIAALIGKETKELSFFYKKDDSVFCKQKGIFRVNCVDCLDRTNVAQFTITRIAFLNILSEMFASETVGREVIYENLKRNENTANVLADMFVGHGNKISQQYGGSSALHSHLIKRDSVNSEDVQNNGKLKNLFGKAKNIFNSAKRIVSNHIFDSTKQHAYNLFLGCFIPSEHETIIFDNSSLDEQNDFQDVDILETTKKDLEDLFL